MSESIHLLLLEDNPVDVLLFRLLLAKTGAPDCRLLHAERLHAALEILHAHHIDVILTDLNLPDSLGRETVRALVHEAAGAPVVVLTGDNDPEQAARLARDGAAGHFCKDHLDAPALSRIVREARQRKAEARV